MSKKPARHPAFWLPLVLGVSTGILVHNVALSTYELLEHALPEKPWQALLDREAAILGIGVMLGVGLFFLAKRIRERMEQLLIAGGASVSGRLLDPVLIRQLPGRAYEAWLVLLGLTVILFLCALHWVGHAGWHYLAHALEPFAGGHWWIVGVSCVLTLAAAYYLRQWERPELSAYQGGTGELDALVIFLSTPNKVELPGTLAGEEFRAAFPRILKSLPLRSEAIKADFALHNWAMPIMAISEAFAQGSLTDVVVIGSADSPDPKNPDGSWSLARYFAETVGNRMGDHPPKFHIWPEAGGINFTDFDALEETIEEAYKFLQKRGARRIAIDLTGGTAICSIVGLLHCLPAGRNAMYITNSLDVRAYDFRYSAPGAGAVGDEPKG